MKKNVLIYLTLIAFGLTACDNEVAPVASNADEDRVLSQIELSNTTINSLYNDYGMGVLFEYDNIKDFAYVASSDSQAEIWGSIEIPKISTLYESGFPVEYPTVGEYRDAAALFLNDKLFKFFKPNTKIATLMPYKVLVSESVFSTWLVSGESGQVITESENRFSSSARNNLRTVYNDHSIVFGLNLSTLTKSTDITKFTKDNFYILLCRIMRMHNLYDLVPAAFFGDRSEYYGTSMENAYRADLGLAPEATVQVIAKNWVYEKGFVDAQYFYNGSSGLRTIFQTKDFDGNTISPRITHLKGFAPKYDFLSDKDKDVRSYLNEMIYRNATEINAFPTNIKDNMKILLDVLTDLGVDMIGINPDLSVLN